MSSFRNRKKFVFSFVISLLLISMLWACNPPKTEAPPDARTALVNSLKGVNVDGYTFTTESDDNQETAKLTNGAVKGPIKLARGTNNLVINYARIKDKKANSTRTVKTEVVRSGNDVSVVVTDLANGAVVTQDRFPTVAPGETFESFEACQADFDCKRRPALQAEANRTCRPQFAAQICCVKGQQFCISVHYIIQPTRRICGLIGPIGDIDEVFVEQ